MRKSFHKYSNIHAFLYEELFLNLKDWCHSDVKFHNMSGVILEAMRNTNNYRDKVLNILIDYCIKCDDLCIFNYIKRGVGLTINITERDFVSYVISEAFFSDDISFFKKLFSVYPKMVYLYQIEQGLGVGLPNHNELVRKKASKLKFMLHFDINNSLRSSINKYLGLSSRYYNQ